MLVLRRGAPRSPRREYRRHETRRTRPDYDDRIIHQTILVGFAMLALLRLLQISQ